MFNKKLKIGLVGTGIYLATALASPLYAGNLTTVGGTETTRKHPVVKEQVVSKVENPLDRLSASQLRARYESNLYTFTKNSELTSPEIENLYILLAKYLEVKNKSHNLLIDESLAEDKTLTAKDAPNDSLSSLIQKLEKEILVRYPDLCSENPKVLKYDAFQPLKEGETLKELIEEAEKQTKEKFPKFLLGKESYDMKDLVVFTRFLRYIDDNMEPVGNIPDVIPVLPGPRLSLSTKQFNQVKDVYKVYLDARDKEFAKAKKYWVAGMEMDVAGKSIGFGEGFFTEELVRSVEDALELQGYPRVGLSSFYTDTDFKGRLYGKVPTWLLVIAGIGFPFLRTFLTTKGMRRKYDQMDGAGNLVNAMFGTMLLDIIHPYVFPIRMLATPFIFEPIRRKFDLYNL